MKEQSLSATGRYRDALAALGQAEVTAAPEPVEAIDAGMRTTARLNMRAAAPLGAVLLTLPAGQPVEILGTWHLARAVVGGMVAEGWVSGAYVEPTPK